MVSGCFLPPPAEDKPLTGELDEAFTVDSSVGGGVVPDPVDGPAVDVPGSDSGFDSGSDPGSISGDGSAPDTSEVDLGVAGAAEVASAEPDSSGVSPEAGASESTGPGELVPEGTGTVAATQDSASNAGAAEEPASSSTDVGADSALESDGVVDTAIVEVQESTATDLKPVGDAPDTVATLPDGFDAQGMERDPDVDPPVGPAGELTPKELQSTVAEGEPRDIVAPAPPGAASSPPDGDGSESTTNSAAESTAGDGSSFSVREHKTDDDVAMTYEIGGPSSRVVGTQEPSVINQATVVFIHGWCGNRSQWRSHMEKLAADSVVLSVDLLGHGLKSPGDAGFQARDEWTIPRYGQDVAGVIEAEDLRDVILVGHAMGGQVALEVALRIPDRIAGIIGVESLHELNVAPKEPLDSDGTEEYLAAFENNFSKAFAEFISSFAHPDTPPPVLASIMEDAEQCSPSVAIKLMKHFQTRDLKRIARDIECPVRCINSELVKTDVEGNRTLLTGFDAKAMSDVGFWPHVERPESFQTELLIQVKEILAPRAPRERARITGLNPVLFSDDLEALATFYVSQLGFEETNRQPADLDRKPSLMVLERDEWRIQLQSRESLATDIPGVEDITVGGRLLFFNVTDLAEERKRLGADVKVVEAFRTLESRSQQTIIRDPEDNVIVLQQPFRRLAPAKD
jgi:pimeloyl-ACP methyl ester carboxylesterase/predicted enzyme related to lactoylglutathione lyase